MSATSNHCDWSRRNWLRTAATASGAAALGFPLTRAVAEGPNDANRKQTPIDAHVHVWTPDTERYPLSAGYRRDEMKPPSFTPEELFEHARPCGVGRVVLIQMSFYGFDNSYMLDTIRRFPGVYSGVAVIDDSSPDLANQMRELAKQGVRGFRINPRNLPVDRWLGSDGMQAMWRCGADDGLAMCHLVNPDALAAIDVQCKEFPDTLVVIDHFARIGVDGTIRSHDVDALCRLARHRKTYVKLSAFYALGDKKSPYLDLLPMIRRLLDAFGPERLMWATDCPYQVQEGHNYADSIALIRDRLDGLSPGDRDWLLRRTAEKVFFA
jgi:predicted TIM-barrel fold metal-dependent hydrolase